MLTAILIGTAFFIGVVVGSQIELFKIERRAAESRQNILTALNNISHQIDEIDVTLQDGK